MPSTDYFEELYGVTEERALNWKPHSHEAIGSQLWSEICDSTGVYLPACLVIFACSRSNGMAILSPDYSPGDSGVPTVCRSNANRGTHDASSSPSAKNPLWMESAGAHILLYAVDSFKAKTRTATTSSSIRRHGSRECYLMAAVGKGKDDEVDGGRLQSISLPFGRPPSTICRKADI